MRRTSGFTLIEMMVVVAIIAILSAIALPNLLRNKVQTNETSAIENLRQVCVAQVSHHNSHESFGDFASLISVADGPGTAFLNNSWAEGVVKNGYTFTMPQADAGNFICYATPVTVGVTGNRYFRIDTSGVVRYSTSGQPAATDPPVGS